jgi:uncharacterized protein (DUF362 family)
MNKPRRYNRRTFLKQSGVLAASLALPACACKSPQTCFSGFDKLPILDEYSPNVSSIWIPKGEHSDSYGMFKKMIEAVTDFTWLSAGDRVFVKLALNSGNVYPATTDPWALGCMIRLLREKGAGEISVGDQSGVESVQWTKDNKRGSSRQCCEKAGLLKIITDLEARPVFFEELGYDSYKETWPAGSHHWQQPILVTNFLDEVDHIVCLPRVAAHVLSGITSGMKLGVGFLREDSRRVFHQGGDHFYAMYEEINHIPEISSKLRLLVSSGRSVLSNFGPDNGHVSQPDHGLVFASDDILAHETISNAWLLWNNRHETPFYSHATSGTLTNLRSPINKAFVWWFWRHRDDLKHTQDIALIKPDDIYQHPSVINAARRMGGRPRTVNWEQINKLDNKVTLEFIEKHI